MISHSGRPSDSSKCSIDTCCGPQAALSRVALPSQTQSCAFVVVSLGGLLPDASWLAAALAAPDSTGSVDPLSGESGGCSLNLFAKATQEAKKTMMAKQKAPRRTYIPISSGLTRFTP